jgi:hypothetical protein
MKNKKPRFRRQAYNGSKQISFLPESKFNPQLPSKNTLAHQALQMMLQGKKLTHPLFQNKTCSWRLAAHVHILKKLGWSVSSIEIPFYTEKKPTSRNIHCYFFSSDVIKKTQKLAVEVAYAR